jgi:hypothetical protein
MTDLKKQHFYTYFPLMFDGLPSGYFSCGEGWYDLLHCLCHTIQGHIDSRERQNDWLISRGDVPTHDLVPQVRVQQIKEKFGTLRFYFRGGDEYIYGAVQLAEIMSECLCEDCGAPGKVREGGWIRTLCDRCEENRHAV